MPEDQPTPNLPATYTAPPKGDGRFKAGADWAGNSTGRPKGIKNRITTQRLLIEEGLREQLAVNAEALLAKAVIMALDGNDKVMRVLLDKLMSTPKNDDGEGAKDSAVSITITNLTSPGKPVATIAPGKVRVIASDEIPIDGDLI